MKLFEKQLAEAAQAILEERKANRGVEEVEEHRPGDQLVKAIRKPQFFRGARVRQR